MTIDDFEDFVRSRSTALLRTSFLLVGDRGHAEDLLQEVLSKTAKQWHRIEGPPEPYVRRALLNAAVNGWKRRRIAESPLESTDVAVPDASESVVLRDALLAGLRGLPPRQRAVLVCRYFDDLSEADTAELLGVSVGTVKQQPVVPVRDRSGVVDPRGTRWHQHLAEISPARALELAKEGAPIAWDPCGCGGFCGFDWYAADDVARMVAAGTPKVTHTKRRRGNLSVWTSDDGGVLVVAEDAVQWGDVISG